MIAVALFVIFNFPDSLTKTHLDNGNNLKDYNYFLESLYKKNSKVITLFAFILSSLFSEESIKMTLGSCLLFLLS